MVRATMNVGRRIIMGEQNIINFRVNDIVFDTADSVVLMSYDIERDYLQYVEVASRLCDIQQSTKEWCDIVSYGQCLLDIFSMDILIEIADCIKDKEWLYIYNTYSSWAANTPLKDDGIKQAVLKRLYNARTDLSNFIAEKLKEDGFDDITDSQGWIELLAFTRRLERRYDISISFPLLLDSLNGDDRFIIKGTKIDDWMIKLA